MESLYFNSECCSSCGGICCKNSPGLYRPEDITPITKDRVLDLILNHGGDIDYFVPDEYLAPDILLLRPQVVGRKIGSDSLWPLKELCVHLSHIGCRLDVSKRPYSCVRYIPDYPNCRYLPEDGADKRAIATAWLPYQEVLRSALDEIYNMQD